MDHKPHLVKGTTVCLDKRFGGLVVKELFSLDKALLCKLSRCYANESGAVCVMILLEESVVRKRGVEHLCFQEEGLWKRIRKWC